MAAPCLRRFVAGVLIAEALVRSQVNSFEICRGQSGDGTGLASSTSISPVYIIPPKLHTHLYLSTRCSYQKGKRGKPGNLPKATPFRNSTYALLLQQSNSLLVAVLPVLPSQPPPHPMTPAGRSPRPADPISLFTALDSGVTYQF